LTQHADCVLPVENQSLAQILEQNPAAPPCYGAGVGAAVRRRMMMGRQHQEQPGQQGMKRGGGFDEMNGVMARVLIDLTASMRFAGDLNVDLNEITTNLVPYPRMHYLMSSLSHPCDPHAGGASTSASTSTSTCTHGPVGGGGGQAEQTSLQLSAACEGAFARRNQLMRADPRQGTVLACALLFRGRDLSLSDVTTNVQRLQSQLRMCVCLSVLSVCLSWLSVLSVCLIAWGPRGDAPATWLDLGTEVTEAASQKQTMHQNT
jgi:tubulin epsilon